MQHGPDCICYGFDFGVRDRVVYLSDFTSISEEVYEVIEERSALEVSPLPASIFVLIFLSSTQGSKHPRPRQPQARQGLPNPHRIADSRRDRQESKTQEDLPRRTL
mmetsp:Transcript_20366/g.68054  ORF Transcript_20366/g.68054 Transcript_20366/m.68054 type:complete len:106 (-) Transcript_20366:3066-3383(-)